MIHDADRIGEPRRGPCDELQVKLGGRRFGPAGVVQPRVDPLAASRCELIDLAIGAVGLANALRGQQAGLLEPGERDVHLTLVERVGQGTEREGEARPQPIAVRSLAGEEREQDLADDAQLIALERLSVGQGCGFGQGDAVLEYRGVRGRA